jgi:hypothetical protein
MIRISDFIHWFFLNWKQLEKLKLYWGCGYYWSVSNTWSHRNLFNWVYVWLYWNGGICYIFWHGLFESLLIQWQEFIQMLSSLESVSVLMIAQWLVLIKATWEKSLSTSAVLKGCMIAMLILFSTCLFIDLQILMCISVHMICNKMYINNESCRCIDAKSWKCSAETFLILSNWK